MAAASTAGARVLFVPSIAADHGFAKSRRVAAITRRALVMPARSPAGGPGASPRGARMCAYPGSPPWRGTTLSGEAHPTATDSHRRPSARDLSEPEMWNQAEHESPVAGFAER